MICQNRTEKAEWRSQKKALEIQRALDSTNSRMTNQRLRHSVSQNQSHANSHAMAFGSRTSKVSHGSQSNSLAAVLPSNRLIRPLRP